MFLLRSSGLRKVGFFNSLKDEDTVILGSGWLYCVHNYTASNLLSKHALTFLLFSVKVKALKLHCCKDEMSNVIFTFCNIRVWQLRGHLLS